MGIAIMALMDGQTALTDDTGDGPVMASEPLMAP